MDDYYESYDVSVTCSACLCQLETDEQRQLHYTSEWHIYNIKRKTAELPPIPYELFHEKFAMVQKMQEEEKLKKGKITCPITKREFKSQGAYEHFRGTKQYAKEYEHYVQKRQKEQLAVQQGIDLLAEPIKNRHTFQWFPPQPEDDQMTENDKALLEQDKLDEETTTGQGEEVDQHEKSSSSTTTTATTTTTTTTPPSPTMVDGEGDGDDDDEQPLQEGQIAIPLKYSLFDHTGPFSCSRTAFVYMVKKFNFKIPYLDFLIDFEGLTEYLGAKIGIGHVCIGCNRRFPTTHGCMTHMVDQNHTTFTLEVLQQGNDDPDDPHAGDFLFDFYDFSHNFTDSTYTPEEVKQRQMSRLRTLLVLGKKSLADISLDEAKGNNVLSKVLYVPVESDIQLAGLTDDGDIKLSDGSKIVSRKNKKDHEKQRQLIYYEAKNRQIMEYKLANKSVMTKEKEQDLHELKHHQKYWRRELQKTGLRNNYIIKEYFRKANQQNN